VTERWGYEWIVSREADERIGDRLRRIAEENMREAARMLGLDVTALPHFYLDRYEADVTDRA
jgi:LmbE family N-acetylglucosaminyl deacetylase